MERIMDITVFLILISCCLFAGADKQEKTTYGRNRIASRSFGPREQMLLLLRPSVVETFKRDRSSEAEVYTPTHAFKRGLLPKPFEPVWEIDEQVSPEEDKTTYGRNRIASRSFGPRDQMLLLLKPSVVETVKSDRSSEAEVYTPTHAFKRGLLPKPFEPVWEIDEQVSPEKVSAKKRSNGNGSGRQKLKDNARHSSKNNVRGKSKVPHMSKDRGLHKSRDQLRDKSKDHVRHRSKDTKRHRSKDQDKSKDHVLNTSKDPARHRPVGQIQHRPKSPVRDTSKGKVQHRSKDKVQQRSKDNLPHTSKNQAHKLQRSKAKLPGRHGSARIAGYTKEQNHKAKASHDTENARRHKMALKASSEKHSAKRKKMRTKEKIQKLPLHSNLRKIESELITQ